MQPWFFLDERSTKQRLKIPKRMSVPTPEKQEITTQSWLFSVTVQNISSKEKLFITGSTDELGEWDYKRIVALDHEENKCVWSKSIKISNTSDVFYRYIVCVLNEETNEISINRWENHIKPRVVKTSMLHPVVDSFGDYNGEQKFISGWLTSQNLVQFKFFNNPLKLKNRLSERVVKIKVTPVKLCFGTEVNVEDFSLSTDTADSEPPAGVSVEVSTLDNNPVLCSLQPQEQFGREYKPNDTLLVNIYAPNPKNIAYLIDFYTYSQRASDEDPPCHIGYTYVLPNMFRPSEGSLELPVTCNIKHRPLGTINFEYLIIQPMEKNLNSFEVSYAKHWDPAWTGLEVGHRGLGASFKTKEYVNISFMSCIHILSYKIYIFIIVRAALKVISECKIFFLLFLLFYLFIQDIL